MIKEFKLGAKTYKVEIYSTPIHGNLLGNAHHDIGIISLATETEDHEPIPSDFIEHTFYHELVHCILCIMGENELCKNEQFVDMFGLLLHQFENTKITE
jgi:hypothetical protein